MKEHAVMLLVAGFCFLGAIAVVVSAFLDRRNERKDRGKDWEHEDRP